MEPISLELISIHAAPRFNHKHTVHSNHSYCSSSRSLSLSLFRSRSLILIPNGYSSSLSRLFGRFSWRCPDGEPGRLRTRLFPASVQLGLLLHFTLYTGVPFEDGTPPLSSRTKIKDPRYVRRELRFLLAAVPPSRRRDPGAHEGSPASRVKSDVCRVLTLSRVFFSLRTALRALQSGQQQKYNNNNYNNTKAQW